MEMAQILLTCFALLAFAVHCEDYCDSQSGEPSDDCAGELSCYGCTAPVLNLDDDLRDTFGKCIQSESEGGQFAKCYKTDSKACAVVKIYNNDATVKPYYLRGCVGDEDDHYQQLCVDSNKVLLRRFCYNTLRNMFAVNLPVGKDDDDMAAWNCISKCCSCNGCNKNFVTLEDSDGNECQDLTLNVTAENLQTWYRSSMDNDSEVPRASFDLRATVYRGTLFWSSALTLAGIFN